jgi:DNA-binding NtrC family response regulator
MNLLEWLTTIPYSWKELQQVLIKATLLRHNGNKTHAAVDLGISLRTLRNKCRKYKL